MIKEFDLTSPIVGDVEAVTEVTVNTKGGSMTATLKKALREKLGELGKQIPAAALQFASGQAVVILSSGLVGSSAGMPVRVHKIGQNRFEIELDTGEDEEVDDVTAAFLKLKESQFVSGDLELTAPVNADEWRAEMDRKLSMAREVVDKLPASSKATE